MIKSRKMCEEKVRTYRLLGIVLGFLGILNFIAVGTYVCYLCFNWPLFDPRSFVFEGYFAFALTTIGVVLLMCGCFLMWTGEAFKGGIVFLVAGIVLSTLVCYFFFVVQPSFLGWLGFLVFSLPVPPLLGGLMGIILHRSCKASAERLKA